MEGSEIGRRLRQIRQARGKSLAVVAGLAGISPGYLSRLEHGERALDRRSLIVRLARALDVAPTELVDLAFATPDEAREETALGSVRLALLAVGMGRPGGQITPVDVLSGRVSALLEAQQRCRHTEVGAALPGLIRDTHTTLAAGKCDADVLRLLVVLHVQGTQAWLRDVGGSLDLGWQAAAAAQQAAERLGEPASLGVAAFGTAHGLIAAGAFDLARQRLADTPTPTAISDHLQLAGMLAFTESLLAAADGRAADVVAPLDHAADLATRTGEGNAWWFGFGPSNVAVWRLVCALETGEHAAAAAVAESVDPRMIPSPQRQAAYWADYGRALAHIRGRHDDAVVALRRAELISPARVHRHPFARQTIAELMAKAKNGATGRELRGMAYRAGLPV